MKTNFPMNREIRVNEFSEGRVAMELYVNDVIAGTLSTWSWKKDEKRWTSENDIRESSLYSSEPYVGTDEYSEYWNLEHRPALAHGIAEGMNDDLMKFITPYTYVTRDKIWTVGCTKYDKKNSGDREIVLTVITKAREHHSCVIGKIIKVDNTDGYKLEFLNKETKDLLTKHWKKQGFNTQLMTFCSDKDNLIAKIIAIGITDAGIASRLLEIAHGKEIDIPTYLSAVQVKGFVMEKRHAYLRNYGPIYVGMENLSLLYEHEFERNIQIKMEEADGETELKEMTVFAAQLEMLSPAKLVKEGFFKSKDKVQHLLQKPKWEVSGTASGAGTVFGIKIAKNPTVVENATHMQFKLVLSYLNSIGSDSGIMLVGGSGTGKTAMCQQIAKKMDIPFYFTGAVNSEYKLLGFKDAYGNYQGTNFRDAFEGGGLFLFDEIDASNAQALLTVNAALSNGMCDFPDHPVTVNKNFRFVAAANTFGQGATRQYIGRNQIDDATLDRFITIPLDYDEALEMALAPEQTWAGLCQLIRSAVMKEHMNHIISMRATILGGKALLNGVEIDDVLEHIVFKSMNKTKKYNILRQVFKEFSKTFPKALPTPLVLEAQDSSAPDSDVE